MKTERRHELQKNELADALGHELDYIKPYAKTIVGVLIAVAAVATTIAFLSSQRAEKNATAWGDFFNVIADSDPKEMASLAETHPGTSAALWAELAAGDMKLATGSRHMFDDRKEAEVNLDQAKRHFENVSKQAGKQVLLARRAKLGLAQTYEAMNEPEAAQPIYEELVKENAEDAFGLAAKERLAQMKRLSEENWYAWFSAYKPVPPTDPLQGRGPLDLDNLSPTNDLNRRPGLEAPGIIGNELMEDEKSDSPIQFDSPGTKAPEAPKPDDSFPAKPESTDPAAEEKPADDKPADAPATEDKPADEKPAEEKPTDEKPAEEKPAEEKPAEESAAPPAEESQPE